MPLGTPASPPTPDPDLSTETTDQASGIQTQSITISSIQAALQKQRAENARLSRLEAEQSLRQTIVTTVRETEQTATTESAPSVDAKVRTEQNTATTSRLNPTDETRGSGPAPGRSRSDAEDTGNLDQRQTVNSVQATFNRVPVAAISTTANHTRDAADISRSRSKLQRRCNHIFIPATGICRYCQKKRTAHV